MDRRAIVLGGGYSGLLAAVRLAHGLRRAGGKVVIVDESPGFVERIRFHQLAAGQRLRRWKYADWLRPAGVAFRQGRVVGIDTKAARVEVQSSDGKAEGIAYDVAIYCLGSRESAIPSDLAAEGETVHTISSESDAVRLREAIARNPGASLLICGAGATGIELAFELIGKIGRLAIAAGGSVAPFLGPSGRRHIELAMASNGIDLRSSRVRRFENGWARFEDGSRLACDLLVWAGGFAVSEVARAAGLEVDGRGRVRVDETLQSTSHPEIYAAGDAAVVQPRWDLRMGCATAMPQGAQVGENVARALAGLTPLPLRYGYSVACLSLGAEDGVFQRLDSDGSPRGRPVVGRAGRLLKESVMRYTRFGLSWERRAPGAYWWSHGPRARPASAEQ